MILYGFENPEALVAPGFAGPGLLAAPVLRSPEALIPEPPDAQPDP